MAGNFNAGGYGVTNIGSPYIGFQDGTYISPSNVALWNSFIQGTSVALTVSTEFDGNVTGVWNNLTLRKNSIDEMQFLDLTTSPTGTPLIGRMVWDADRETIQVGLDAALDLDIGQQQFALVKNAESVTISNGMVVYLSGASGDKATVKIASYSNDFLSARTMGIAAENIGPNGVGYIVTRGPVYKQNTAAFAEGSVLYLGAYGNLTTNRPAAPLHGVFIGVAEKINANAGVIYVAIQNGFELDELHDVNLAAPATNDLLIYNGTVWTNYARTNLSGIYLPLAGGTMSGNINMNDQEIDLVNQINYGADYYISLSGGEIGGTSPWTLTQQPTIPGYLTSTGAASTYVQITNLPAQIVTTNNLSTIAGSGLAVSNNQLVVTNVGNIGSADIDVNTFSITNIGNLYGFNSYGNIVFPEDDIPFLSGQWNMGTNINYTGTSGDFVVGNDQVNTSPSLVISNENGAVFMNLIDTTFTITTSNTNLDNSISFNSEEVLTTGDFSPTAYLKISAANTNYWKISTAPTTSTSFGTYGQAAISGTNMYFYNHLSNKWLRINGTLEW